MSSLRECRRPDGMQPDEALVYDFCVQLSLNHRVPDDLWSRAVASMGEQQVIDLVVLSGTYVMVSMLLNATQVGLPSDDPLPLEVLPAPEIHHRLLA